MGNVAGIRLSAKAGGGYYFNAQLNHTFRRLVHVICGTRYFVSIICFRRNLRRRKHRLVVLSLCRTDTRKLNCLLCRYYTRAQMPPTACARVRRIRARTRQSIVPAYHQKQQNIPAARHVSIF